MKKVIHLNLKRKWFDMILSGAKKEEYRDKNDYWWNFFSARFSIQGESTFHSYFGIKNNEQWYILFSNGYAKSRPQFEVELKDIYVGTGNEEWGALPNIGCFVLRLGEIVWRKDC